MSHVAIPGDRAILIVADHASNAVPEDVSLGVTAELMTRHMAFDIGVAPLAALLCARLGCGAHLGDVSRLVIDLNREEDADGLIPTASDGHLIPANMVLDESARQARVERFWRPYHDALAARIAADRPALLVSLHSFTPRLSSRPEETRPWQVGVLYNRDERAARLGIPLLEAAGIVTGDNQPYSGKLLNATMNRHAESGGIPYLGLEVRQDLIGAEDGVAAWAVRLAPVIAEVARALRS